MGLHGKKSDKNTFDTIYLSTLNEHFEWDPDQRKIRWVTIVRDSNKVLKDTTIAGVIEREGIPFIDLLPPSDFYLRLAKLVGEPEVKLPVELGNKKKVETKIILGPLEAIEAIVGSEVSGKSYYYNPLVKDTCWVIDAFGNSEKGNFKARYYFHEKLGFVYFYYEFVSYQVEINLIALK